MIDLSSLMDRQRNFVDKTGKKVNLKPCFVACWMNQRVGIEACDACSDVLANNDCYFEGEEYWANPNYARDKADLAGIIAWLEESRANRDEGMHFISSPPHDANRSQRSGTPILKYLIRVIILLSAIYWLRKNNVIPRIVSSIADFFFPPPPPPKIFSQKVLAYFARLWEAVISFPK